MSKKLVVLAMTLLFTACSSMPAGEQSFPKTREEEQNEAIGKLTGEDGIVLFGGSSKSAATEGINVNSFLWRASLDAIHQMPLISADPFGGTIITDWYKLEPKSNHRYKLNIYIVGGELRSDAIKVGAFKQQLESNGQWSEAIAHPQLAKDIENKILLKARELKFQVSK